MTAGLTFAASAMFEVATIKPALLTNPMDAMHGSAPIGMKIDGARVDIAGLTLLDLIRTAYRLKPYQIVAPEWMRKDRWDIQAKLPEGAKTEQVPEMLQALLEDRFKVAVHRESKEHAVYALVVGKSGAKLMESAEAGPKPPSDNAAGGHGQGMSMPIGAGAKDVFLTSEAMGPVKVSMVASGVRLEAEKASMAALADMLSRMVDRPVIDMTGLKGKYDVALDLAPENIRSMATTGGFATAGMGPGARTADGSHGDGPAGSEPGATVFQSVQQLGLRLESRRASMETLVVDRAEKAPTRN